MPSCALFDSTALRLLVAALLVAGAAMPVAAQSTLATITGMVSDPTGAALPGARIEATHIATNYVFRAVANEAGVYTLAQIRDGEYSLRVTAAGFKETTMRGVGLGNRDVRRIDFRLEVGAVETRVEVTAQAAAIETESARISNTKGEGIMKTLPLNSRHMYSFVSLLPGVQSSSTSASTRFSGSWKNQGDGAVDGITINATDGSQISPLVSYMESFEEVRVDTANNTADVAAVGQVVMVSKSGSNRYRGSVFDYYSSPFFRARPMLGAQRDLSIRHTPGVSSGGPVWIPRVYDGRNRSFFFLTYETNRGNTINQLISPTVPAAPWRSGDFSRESAAVRDPLSGTPFPDKTIPASRINPTAKKMQDLFYPMPNFGNPNTVSPMNYRVYRTREWDPNTIFTVRGDHRFNEKNFAYARYTWNRAPNRYYEPLPALGRAFRQRDTRSLNLSYTRTISNSMVNEARYGYSNSNDPRWGGLMGLQVTKELGLTGLMDGLPDIPGVPNLSFSGLSLTTVRQTEYRNPGFGQRNYQFHDLFSWFRGRHGLKMGMSVTRQEGGEKRATDNVFGNLTFSNRYAGHAYADFLMGMPTTTRRDPGPLDNTRYRWGYDWFFTDEWKVTRTLTVSAGMRYEYHPAWFPKYGARLSMFDPASGRIVIGDGSRSLISSFMPDSYIGLVEAKELGLPKTLIRTDCNNLAPRFAIAWRPFGEKTVFRAGVGIFYDLVPSNASVVSTPYNVSEPAYNNPAGTPVVVLPNIYPGASGKPSTASIPRAYRPDDRIPYTIQQNVTIQREQWGTAFRVSYVGTGTRQGEWAYNLNAPVPDARLYIEKTRAFPNYSAIQYQTNGAGHQYHAMEVEAKRRLARGLHAEFNWTWARDVGDLERAGEPENPYNRRRERGVWVDIPTHATKGNVMYELPFGRGRKLLSGVLRKWNLLAGGWSLSFIHSHGSGQFLTPAWTGPDPTINTTSSTPAQVTIRPDILRAPNLPKDRRTMARYFDTGAFGPPQKGAYGTSAPGVIKGPGYVSNSAGLYKGFEITERVRLRWEATFGNVFNHPAWNNPGTNINSPLTLGVITWAGGERSGQTGLRLEW